MELRPLTARKSHPNFLAHCKRSTKMKKYKKSNQLSTPMAYLSSGSFHICSSLRHSKSGVWTHKMDQNGSCFVSETIQFWGEIILHHTPVRCASRIEIIQFMGGKFMNLFEPYPIGSMYAIYGNMDPINISLMLAYIPAPWILQGGSPPVISWFIIPLTIDIS